MAAPLAQLTPARQLTQVSTEEPTGQVVPLAQLHCTGTPAEPPPTQLLPAGHATCESVRLAPFIHQLDLKGRAVRIERERLEDVTR